MKNNINVSKQAKRIIGRLIHKPEKEIRDKTVYTRKLKHKKKEDK